MTETSLIWMNNERKNPKISVYQSQILLELVKDGNLNGLKSLLNFNVARAREIPLNQMIEIAIENQNIDIFQYLIAHPDAQNLFGWDLLCLAAKVGNCDIIMEFVKLSFWINFQYKEHLNPYGISQIFGHQNAQEIIKEHLANILDCQDIEIKNRKIALDLLEDLKKLHQKAIVVQVQNTLAQEIRCKTQEIEAIIYDNSKLWAEFVIVKQKFRSLCWQKVKKQIVISGLRFSQIDLEEILEEAVQNGGVANLSTRAVRATSVQPR